MPTRAERVRRYALYLALLCAVFGQTVAGLVRLSLGSVLYSHLLMMPAIAAYLVFLRRRELPAPAEPSLVLGLLLLAVGIAADGIAHAGRAALAPQDALSLGTFGLVTCAVAGIPLFFGAPVLRAVLVPALLLFFAGPFPLAVESWLAEGLQRASADAAHALFLLTRTPILRDGLVFYLPNLTVEVAEECSGIHSTLVLVITGLVAADVLLRPGWRKWALIALVLPLGIARNGFRILAISWLTIRVDPAVIRGPIHRQGGPIFFILSLVVLLAILMILRRTEPGRRLESAGGAS